MKPNSIYTSYSSRQLVPAERRTLRNLASSLCQAMGIPQQDHQLIALLGLGSERSNLEAMGTWVYGELTKSHLEVGRDSLPMLIRRLQNLEDGWRYL
ncbi:hypothetical protein [Marinobacter sp. LV10MA510-1]|uniref:hypothetical protein n=1 Tax=Marinobacter sp. LV10MA510-1 TaxID=1415567 RepID=UPI000BF45F47|nr:hypothetical protein [Marinobacter sp. LV10MA510-1]PFG10133.1 hypothetical protein ATI45_2548 [Marinobacter sp. LV10MA510-1]